jgi:hypothetical protein
MPTENLRRRNGSVLTDGKVHSNLSEDVGLPRERRIDRRRQFGKHDSGLLGARRYRLRGRVLGDRGQLTVQGANRAHRDDEKSLHS